MKNTTGLAKIVLYELVFNRALPDDTPMKVARKTAQKIAEKVSMKGVTDGVLV